MLSLHFLEVICALKSKVISSNMNIQSILTNSIVDAVQNLFGAEASINQVQLQKTRKEFDGDITVVVFPFVKVSKKGPEQTGEALGAYLTENLKEVKGFNVVKGFLNLSISPEYWGNFFLEAYKNENFGFAVANSKPHIMVEYSSPNTNKPLHLGHLRNNFLGYSVAEILKANGHKISKVQIINDRGIHICKSMVAWQKLGNGETPESANIKGDKLVGKYYVEFDKLYKAQQKELIEGGMEEAAAAQEAPIMKEAQDMLRKWEAKDEEVYNLWKTMNSWVYKGFEATYKAMGVDFDKLYFESETYLLGRDEVIHGLEKGIFFKKEDGSIWVDLTDQGLDQKALLRKDGTAMYITQDIGTAILRFRDFPDIAYQIYTVGNEQEYHFNVLFKILKKLGFEWGEQCYHLSYGMVELPEGKMKSREGTVVDADDIMNEMKEEARSVAAEQGKLEALSEEDKEVVYHNIGMAALKYFLLKVDPVKNMMFNPKESIDFTGNTGPFIQYSYVRTRAILRKYQENFGELNYSTSIAPELLNAGELALIQKLHDFPEIVEEAGKSYNPGIIANYTFELVKEFSSYYNDYPVLREENAEIRNFRVALIGKIGTVVKMSMGLLGIDMVERM